MIPFSDLLVFSMAVLVLVTTPGPNMIYLVSRSITQGKKAGLVSLAGVIAGFAFHIIIASAGLTAMLFAVPIAYSILKVTGVVYLLYMAYKSIRSSRGSIFAPTDTKQQDKPGKLFRVGFLTNVLNPKVAVFYISFFPQFIKPGYGSVMSQSLLLGATHIVICFMVQLVVVLTASKVALFFTRKPTWLQLQKWFMASILTAMAVKMALTKSR